MNIRHKQQLTHLSYIYIYITVLQRILFLMLYNSQHDMTSLSQYPQCSKHPAYVTIYSRKHHKNRI